MNTRSMSSPVSARAKAVAPRVVARPHSRSFALTLFTRVHLARILALPVLLTGSLVGSRLSLTHALVTPLHSRSLVQSRARRSIRTLPCAVYSHLLSMVQRGVAYFVLKTFEFVFPNPDLPTLSCLISAGDNSPHASYSRNGHNSESGDVIISLLALSTLESQ